MKPFTTKVTRTVIVSNEDMRDILDTFFYSPDPWVLNWKVKSGHADAEYAAHTPVYEGGSIELTIEECDFDSTQVLNRERLAYGLEEMGRSPHQEALGRLLAGEYDYEDADLLIQYALFDEPLFG